MKVIAQKRVEECLDGTIIKEFQLNAAVTKELVHYIGSMGKLDYYGHFPKPFYRITQRGAFILKGVEGNTTFQVLFIRYTSNLENSICQKIKCFRNRH
ncbi:MAG: hypothetical protein QNI92_01385 [Desulfobacterales bacterium]|nr:hypothetical protein [Desulfobacterales bacterium]